VGVFTGDRFELRRRPFHFSLLVSIVEFGGQVSTNDIAEHLLPGVPSAVISSMVRELRREGLLFESDNGVSLTPDGLRSLEDGRVPFGLHGMWIVDWITVEGAALIVKVRKWDGRPTKLTAARRDLRQHRIEPPEEVAVTNELFDRWHLSLLDSCDFSLRKTSPVSTGTESNDTLVVRWKLRSDSSRDLNISLGEETTTVPRGSKLESWIEAVVDRTLRELSLSFHPDDLADREILDLRRTVVTKDVCHGQEGWYASLRLKRVPIQPRDTDRRSWYLRLIQLFVVGVPTGADWAEVSRRARPHHSSLDSQEAADQREVIEDLERRGLKFSDKWWDLVSSLDWQIATLS